jgi:hypothetical protein
LNEKETMMMINNNLVWVDEREERIIMYAIFPMISINSTRQKLEVVVW